MDNEQDAVDRRKAGTLLTFRGTIFTSVDQTEQIKIVERNLYFFVVSLGLIAIDNRREMLHVLTPIGTGWIVNRWLPCTI